MEGPVHTHPGQSQLQAQVILGSCTETGAPPIYTVRVRCPRIIWPEIMTHRVFSRNARSSRAVPAKTMLAEIRDMPFVPWHWTANQKGMQGEAGHDALVTLPLEYEDDHGKEYISLTDLTNGEAWLLARDRTVQAAEAFAEAGYHKQIFNRLVEPFMWIDGLITSTDWENFFWLRDHEDAEPHLQDLARLMDQAITAYRPQTLEPGQWHLPYTTEADWDESLVRPVYRDKFLCVLSAARCARISYAPFDGDASYERELQRYEQLVNRDRIHASPLEHQAQADRMIGGINKWANADLSGNLDPGWVQYRKTIPGEHRTA